jgi:hypothetical protein
MTKAQKENQARFKAVQEEAKKLKAKNPKLSHIMAVKQAWAIMLGKPAKVGSIATKMIIKKPAIKKTGLKAIIKKVPKKMPIAGRLNLTGKETRLGYIPKKVAAKKTPVSKHKDTKSHNVNIKVVSGIDETILEDLRISQKRLLIVSHQIENWKDALKYKNSSIPINDIKKTIKNKLDYIKELKEHIKELKKLI